jgi:hypothetical protein
MTKKGNINVKALFLLMIYLIINIPFALFHHHENEIIAYAEATPCEKSIHYKNALEKCNHDAHVSESTEKCLFCEHHIATPHILIAFYIASFHKVEKEIRHNQTTTDFIFQTSYIASNKGPPTV